MLIKRLAIRLTSLGDVILSSSVLEVPQPDQVVTDWAVAQEYSELFQGHPKIGHVLPFDRSTGLSGWIRFCRKLWQYRYDEVFDLHQSLRTRLMKFLFHFWSFSEGRHSPKWTTVSKQRLRLYLYYLFKNGWPKRLRPSPWVIRFTRSIGGSGVERPNFKHLVTAEGFPLDLESHPQRDLIHKGYLCVMPSSRWSGKNWAVSNYVQVIKKLSYFIVVLGGKSDVQSYELVSQLKKLNIPHMSGVGLWNLRQTAGVLGGSLGYLGGDTGLAHLAESVGIPVKMIFGPTTPEMGFGPWMIKSQAIGLSIWCRPCGKDGRHCHRLFHKHICLKRLSPQTVLETFGVH